MNENSSIEQVMSILNKWKFFEQGPYNAAPIGSMIK